MAEKLNQGEVSVNDIDKNLGKFDQTYMTDEFIQQIAGTTPVNAVTSSLSVTNVKVVDKAITQSKTTFIKKKSNLFNIVASTKDYTISLSGF